MIVVNESQELEVAEAQEAEGTGIDYSVLGGFGPIDQSRPRAKARTEFEAENRWKFSVISTAQDEWKITVVNNSGHFATFAPAYVKASHELKGLDIPVFSLKALGSTTLNPDEPLELALHAVFEDRETGERVESSGQATLTIGYFAWADYATYKQEFKL